MASMTSTQSGQVSCGAEVACQRLVTSDWRPSWLEGAHLLLIIAGLLLLLRSNCDRGPRWWTAGGQRLLDCVPASLHRRNSHHVQ